MNKFYPLLITWIAGCAPYPEGLRSTPDGTGPRVIIDWDAQPLPEIPLPNDLATRPDPTSVTGLRLNISEMAETETESRARRKINELVGFGIYAPFTVSFDAPLDLDNIRDRHREMMETLPMTPSFWWTLTRIPLTICSRFGWTLATDDIPMTLMRLTDTSPTTLEETVQHCCSKPPKRI